ncbi:hypothetical protein LTR56_024048 [Elasticomyces elasticus]|nr:hypothetical protein LTR56_024048 [Elasticomyces elasticus]KAK4908453.1 hypothetical protein LTR49_022659 [Elasticomyces elasticus]KAK5743194.1 hypothetical protein LTS12_023967 [Elasticomyces elasticus]
MRQREKLSMLHRGYAVSPAPPPAPKIVTNGNSRATRPTKKQRQATASENVVQSTTATRGSSSHGLTHSLPVRPPEQAHALPPRPSGSASPLPPKPSAMNLNADATNDTESSPAPEQATATDTSGHLHGTKKAVRKASKKVKAQESRDRAEKWKAAHPGVRLKLTNLTIKQLKALNKTYGFAALKH